MLRGRRRFTVAVESFYRIARRTQGVAFDGYYTGCAVGVDLQNEWQVRRSSPARCSTRGFRRHIDAAYSHSQHEPHAPRLADWIMRGTPTNRAQYLALASHNSVTGRAYEYNARSTVYRN